MTHRGVLAVVILVLLPRLCLAQDASHWGVVGAVTPTWKVPAQLEVLFDGTVDITGRDLSIGVARGRSPGGDWGVSFIHKRFKDGSRVESTRQDCTSFSNGCFKDGDSVTTTGVAINGLEVHKYVPFATIHKRVQIGMNIARGFGKFSGVLERRTFRGEPVTFNPGTGRPTGRQTETFTSEPASELIPISVMPLLKLQAAVGVIAAPALKIRLQGGLDLPGYEYVSVVGVFLLGHARSGGPGTEPGGVVVACETDVGSGVDWHAL